MITKILLIGCGNIGFRHLEGLLKSDLTLEITVIEKLNDKIESSKKKINELNFNKKKIFFYNNFLFNKKNFDLLICATTSNKRYELLKFLVKKFIFSRIILEKLAFQNSYDYKKALKLLNKNNISSWVNCPRREQKIYKEIKNDFKKNDKLSIQVFGNRWNLASNSIHFFDLFYFLKNDDHFFNSNTETLKKIPSKHKNFYELTGLLKIKSKKDVILLNDQKVSRDIIVKIKTSDKEYIVNETKQFVKIKCDKKNIEKKIKIFQQNELTTILIKKIFSNQDINLPTLTEAYSPHKLLYFSFKEHFIIKNKVFNCPIT